jgi:uncharacterized protein
LILVDVNVLVYANRVDSRDHSMYRAWLEEALRSGEQVGMSEFVLCSVVRILTHPRIFPEPTNLNDALAIVDALRGQPACVRVAPGTAHWEIFRRLCITAGAKGALIMHAYLAALAIECHAEWITADRDYARFPGLRWRHPFA